jgi:hypothetical protein
VTALDLAIGAATILVSLGGSAFIAGARWGRVESDMREMASRLARIEGMFTLRLRKEGRDNAG